MDNNLDYLFAAFTVIWVFILGFVLTLSLKQRKLEREITVLEEKMAKKSPRGQG